MHCAGAAAVKSESGGAVLRGCPPGGRGGLLHPACVQGRSGRRSAHPPRRHQRHPLPHSRSDRPGGTYICFSLYRSDQSLGLLDTTFLCDDVLVIRNVLYYGEYDCIAGQAKQDLIVALAHCVSTGRNTAYQSEVLAQLLTPVSSALEALPAAYRQRGMYTILSIGAMLTCPLASWQSNAGTWCSTLYSSALQYCSLLSCMQVRLFLH